MFLFWSWTSNQILSVPFMCGIGRGHRNKNFEKNKNKNLEVGANQRLISN
jgi:hypothetical protein